MFYAVNIHEEKSKSNWKIDMRCKMWCQFKWWASTRRMEYPFLKTPKLCSRGQGRRRSRGKGVSVSVWSRAGNKIRVQRLFVSCAVAASDRHQYVAPMETPWLMRVTCRSICCCCGVISSPPPCQHVSDGSRARGAIVTDALSARAFSHRGRAQRAVRIGRQDNLLTSDDCVVSHLGGRGGGGSREEGGIDRGYRVVLWILLIG